MSDRAASSIYDLGYARYTGARLGRQAILAELFRYSLRGIFGLGRGLGSKVAPMGLVVLAAVPAFAQLAIGALVPREVEVFRAEEYYGYIQVVIALFVAAAAPELYARDRRTGALALYLVRPLSREAYALTKLAALAAALLAATLGPQLVLFVGNALASNDTARYLSHEADTLPAVAASAVLIAVMSAALGAAIAVQSPRRAYTTVGIFAAFFLPWGVASAVVEAAGGGGAGYVLLGSPFHVIRGSTLWMFGAEPQPTSPLATADLYGGLYALAAVVFAALGTSLVVRRYREVAV
jgi:ABC-2 type transport system permease protein